MLIACLLATCIAALLARLNFLLEHVGNGGCCNLQSLQSWTEFLHGLFIITVQSNTNILHYSQHLQSVYLTRSTNNLKLNKQEINHV